MPSPTRGTHRDALLEAAKRLLRERGHAAITARDLVAASNTNLGSIGYHFGSKAALLNEAAGLALEEWVEAIARATSGTRSDMPPEQRLASSLGIVLDEFEAMRPYFLTFVETVVRSSRSPEIREQLTTHYKKQRARVVQMITDALPQTLDAQEADHLASLLMGVSDGLMLQALIDPESMPDSAQLEHAAHKALAATLARSMAATESTLG